MAKILHHSANEKLFFAETLSLSSKRSRRTENHIAKVIFRKLSKKFSSIPKQEINNALRTIFCNIKIQIGQCDISKKDDCFLIKIHSRLNSDLFELILAKSVSLVGLKYKCDNCKLEVENDEKTIFFHY